MSAATENPRPWYREPWPWLLMLPPALSIAGGVVMLVLALGSPSELAVDDYGRIEEFTAERFARDARAAAQGWTADARFVRAAEGAVAVTVTLAAAGDSATSRSAERGTSTPNVLELVLQHAGRRAADRALVLPRAADGAYRGALTLAAGRYDVELSPLDRSWRLGGSLAAAPAALSLRAPAGEL